MSRWWSLLLVRRLAILGGLFSAELALITVYFDSADLRGSASLTLLRLWGPTILRCCIAFSVAFITFAFLRFPSHLADVSRRMASLRIGKTQLCLHTIAILGFWLLARSLYGSAPPVWPVISVLAWLGAGILAIGFGTAAFIQPAFWGEIVRSTEKLWLFATAVGAAAGLWSSLLRKLWPVATGLTFRLVQLFLRPFGSFKSDPSLMTIGSSRFTVEIAPACSGLEGIGLILLFTATWLLLFRKECRFPHAFLLLPGGAAIAFLLNSVRIASLVMIGNLGFEGIAAGGFHSQAGWILFNLVALGICLMARDSQWIANRPASLSPNPAALANPTAPWIAPFVAILGAGMLSRALTADFEWLYFFRFLAAAAVLFAFRRTYVALDWRIDWTAPLCGFLAFVVWIGLDHSASASMPVQLATASRPVAAAWISVRVLAAVITVPVAEELAFRGFLQRRIIDEHFEGVSFRKFSWIAFLASSLMFGLLHGSRWIVGSIAGALYALAVLRRGRFANAVAAHAITNALLAFYVLAFNQWGFW